MKFVKIVFILVLFVCSLFVVSCSVENSEGSQADPGKFNGGGDFGGEGKTYEKLIMFASMSEGSIYFIDYLGNEVEKIDLGFEKTFAKMQGERLFVRANANSRPLNDVSGAKIVEIGSSGEEVWEYQNSLFHHDFVLLPNGNIVAIVWEEMSSEAKERLPFDAPSKYYVDSLLEIDYDSLEVVWEWHAQDKMELEKYDLNSFSITDEFLHLNAIEYLPEGNSLISEEGFLLSSRTLNLVFAVSKSSGEVIWESGREIFKSQHNPTLLSNGNILVFDNLGGEGRTSRVIELDPGTYEIEWEYALSEVAEKISGAQRLENGNTLVTNGPNGILVEVDALGEEVFSYESPYFSENGRNELFRAYSYAYDELKWLLEG